MNTPRLCAMINLILGLAATAAALYIQYVLSQTPCDLCMLQRVVVYAVILISLTIVLFNPRPLLGRCIQVLCTLFTWMGLGLAGRHLYLQSLPEELKPSCGPGLDYLIQHLPFLQAIESLIRGSGECAQVQGLFFGYSLPFWTLLLFAIMGVVSMIGVLRK